MRHCWGLTFEQTKQVVGYTARTLAPEESVNIDFPPFLSEIWVH